MRNFIEVEGISTTMFISVPYISMVAKHYNKEHTAVEGAEVYLYYLETPVFTKESYESVVNKIKEVENQ